MDIAPPESRVELFYLHISDRLGIVCIGGTK